MGIRYRVNSSSSLVTVIVEESITTGDLRHFARELRRHPAAREMPHLVLISERVPTLLRYELIELADAALELPAPTRARQAVVTFTDLHFGQARIFLSRLNLPEARISLFRELMDAIRWLGFRDRAARVELQTLLAMNQ